MNSFDFILEFQFDFAVYQLSMNNYSTECVAIMNYFLCTTISTQHPPPI